ncbi:MAG: DUF4347 domain-containing protein [Pseudomonadota bacterium]
MAIEVTVIDDSDSVGWAAAATRIGEIYMTSCKDMVDNVLAKLAEESEKMSRLNILDHGNTTSFSLGSDWVSSNTLGSYRKDLARLKGQFASDGIVHLQHCQIGQNKALLTSLASIFGVSVYAGKDYQNPVYRLNFAARRHMGWLTGWVKAIPDPSSGFERYVRADPDGTFDEDAGRP